jgi:hypothetical protein
MRDLFALLWDPKLVVVIGWQQIAIVVREREREREKHHLSTGLSVRLTTRRRQT